jgi:hypothetical protein
MRFKFECVKPSEVEDNMFPDIEFPTNLRVVHEFEISDSTRWDNIMLQFAKFLDATGYCGAYEKVEARINADWESITNNLENFDEDFGNSGLSD